MSSITLRLVVWPLVGRDRELEVVGELLADGAAGGVVVVGAAGVGKTRLAGEIARVAGSQGCAVEWVRATRSAASMPFGAFAALVPAPVSGSAGGADLLARVRQELIERASGRRLVLCVDDGHLLDAGSAGLVHQLVAAGEAIAVVTVRRGERAPDAVGTLWKDELCALLAVDALSFGEVERLLVGALGGPIDGRTAAALWERTRGNALFLRELVLHGLEREVLSDEGGIWRWRGEVGGGVRLAELVGARMAALDAAARGAMEVVAIGAPLELGLLAPDRASLLELLEAHGMVERSTDGRRRFVDVAHPLHGEVLRASLPRTRVEAIQARLADTAEARGARRRGDVLRIAAWRLESGATGTPGMFVRAGGHALAALDWAVAERFARAALQAGGGFAARLLLGRALAGAGRASEADELLAALERQASGDGERMAVAIARARNLRWGLERPRDADAVLVHAERAMSDAAVRDELVALRAWLACAEGRPLPALVLAGPLLASQGTRAQARVRAAMAVAMADAMRGRVKEAITVAETAQPIASQYRDELPLLEHQLMGARVHALLVAGRLLEATDAGERLYGAQLADRSHENIAVTAVLLGSAWLARGRVATALRWFRESAALLRETDTIGFRSTALAGIAQAAAQAGDADLARRAVAELEAAPLRGNWLFGHELELARAWSAAAGGELSRARALAGGAADLAESNGQDGFAVRALHDLCRLGEASASAPRLASLAGRVEGPYAPIVAAYATALVERDGARLLAVAQRFADIGALLAAAEAAHAAAAAHRHVGRHDSARMASRRAAVLLEQCEGARPPALLGAPAADELTRREREIAALAAAGLSSRAIAERLVVSVRTVDNHLQRAYRKLGVASRADLAGLITPPRET